MRADRAGPVPDDAERQDVVTAVPLDHAWSYDVVGVAVARGHAAFTAAWDGGGRERTVRARRWFPETEGLLRAALR